MTKRVIFIKPLPLSHGNPNTNGAFNDAHSIGQVFQLIPEATTSGTNTAFIIKEIDGHFFPVFRDETDCFKEL